MTVIVLLIAAGGVVAIGFLAAFVWAVRTGQFDDVVSPAWRVLFDDAPGGRPRSGASEASEVSGVSAMPGVSGMSGVTGDSGERLHVRRDL